MEESWNNTVNIITSNDEWISHTRRGDLGYSTPWLHCKLHLNSQPGWHQGVLSVLMSGVAEVDVSGFSVVEHCFLPLFVCLNHFHIAWFHVVWFFFNETLASWRVIISCIRKVCHCLRPFVKSVTSWMRLSLCTFSNILLIFCVHNDVFIILWSHI